MTTAYPLAWPQGRQRTPPMRRRAGRFCRDGKRLTVAGALSRVKREIVSAGGYLPVISTNVELRLDGVPRSGQREPEDPGVAIYMQIGGRPHCLPCDTYDRVADNLAAVAAHIEATRAIERHGVASVEEMFAGRAAAVAPGARRRPNGHSRRDRAGLPRARQVGTPRRRRQRRADGRDQRRPGRGPQVVRRNGHDPAVLVRILRLFVDAH